jgi:hypothetical protein
MDNRRISYSAALIVFSVSFSLQAGMDHSEGNSAKESQYQEVNLDQPLTSHFDRIQMSFRRSLNLKSMQHFHINNLKCSFEAERRLTKGAERFSRQTETVTKGILRRDSTWSQTFEANEAPPFQTWHSLNIPSVENKDRSGSMEVTSLYLALNSSDSNYPKLILNCDSRPLVPFKAFRRGIQDCKTMGGTPDKNQNCAFKGIRVTKREFIEALKKRFGIETQFKRANPKASAERYPNQRSLLWLQNHTTPADSGLTGSEEEDSASPTAALR